MIPQAPRHKEELDIHSEIFQQKLIAEIDFMTPVRSGGSGGQNVNKTATKMHAIFDVSKSDFLSQKQKRMLIDSGKTDMRGVMHSISQNERSQFQNKQKAVENLCKMVLLFLTPKEERKPTNVPRREKEKRIEDKKMRAQKKAMRRGSE